MSTWQELADLKPDWDSYGADPPSAKAIEIAQQIAPRCVDLFKTPHICASAQGGVGLCFIGEDKRYADIEVLNDGEILCCTSDGSGDPQVWETKLENISSDIETIKSFIELHDSAHARKGVRDGQQ